MRGLTCLIACLVGGSAAYSQCSSFQPVYPGLNGPVKVLASWDPDGSGPELPRLVAGGAFTWNEGLGSQDYIAWWDGTEWSNIGWGPDAPVNAITTWDPDGDGPLPAQLIMGGEFPDVGADSTGAITVNYIALWDGEAWQPLGSGADGPVDALTTWDPDGDGPLPAELVAAGRFTHIGGVWTGGVAHWDGVEWHSFGWGINGAGAALTVWDPDGPGPQIPNLVVGGSFHNAGAASTGGVVVNNIARWDGVAWRAFGVGLNTVRFLTVYDFDLDGPALAAPVAVAANLIWDWDGSHWNERAGAFGQFQYDCLSFPKGCLCTEWTEGEPALIATWDADEAGPIPPQLITSGTQTYIEVTCLGAGCHSCMPTQTTPYDRFGLWDGASWNSFAGPRFSCATAYNPGGTDSMHATLVVGRDTEPFLMVRELSEPVFTLEPRSTQVHDGETVTFGVSAANGPLTYQWLKVATHCVPDGALMHCTDSQSDLADGPSGTGSIYVGSNTQTLSIVGPQSGDWFLSNESERSYTTVQYACVIQHAGCVAPSRLVSFSVLPGTCTADFNHDGDAGTDQDIAAFFACLGGNCCQTCGTADFNGDGDVGTDQDIDSFFRVLGGGAC